VRIGEGVRTRGRAFVGTSGWTYPHWTREFYPPGLPAKRQLAWLATRFATVEVNGTFYSLTRPSAVEAWRACVPPDFLFAVKASRYITHMRKLAGGVEPLANFFAQGILRLGRQLGPILWQLPPQLPFDVDRAGTFLRALPHDLAQAERLARRHDHRLDGRAALRAPDGRDRPLRHAFEVRHESWLGDDALALLAEHGVALVVADTAGRHPFSLASTGADFAYARLHGSTVLYGSQYTDDELDAWAARIRRWLARGLDTYVYFDNDAHAFAPADAARLVERLGGAAAQPPDRLAESHPDHTAP
jgi:uncharacterized protein YecE (DUF72 family)